MVDARNCVLGRLSSRIAILLCGKDQLNFAFHSNSGAWVVVVNARHIKLTGNKLDKNYYYHHSGYPGGLKQTRMRDMLEKQPCYVLKHAVRLMLAKNHLGRVQMRRLFVYPDQNHPHKAQNPEPIINSIILNQSHGQ